MKCDIIKLIGRMCLTVGSRILAKRLKSLRENNGYLQKYVADKIGVRSNTLSGYENGTRSPDPEMIKRLSELYGVTTDFLLGRTDNPNPNNDSHNDIEEDEKLKEFMRDLKVWYHNEPEAEKDLEVFRRIMDTYKHDKN